MAYPDSVTTVTSAAGGSLGDSLVSVAMQKKAIDQNLRLQMTLDDVFASFQSPVISHPDGMDIPNSIFLNLGGEAKRGTHSQTIGMTTPYSGAMQLGDKYIPGTEVKDKLMYAQFFYGEYAYAVARDNFGRTANEMDFFSVYDKQTPKISHYLSEQDGKRIREALLETYDHVLVGDAASGVAAHVFNTNWYVANADPSVGANTTDAYGQIISTHADTDADWEEAMGDIMTGAATGTLGVDANISLEGLRSLAFWARTVKHIEPLDNGKYIVTIPSSQVKTFLGLTADGGTIIQANKREDNDRAVGYTYKLTEVENLEIYVDDRFPVVVQSGADASWALTTKYMQPGNVDDRTANLGPAATNWHIGFLMGKAAVAKWEVTPVHFETELSNYKKREGNGAFGESGYGLVQFDNDTGFATIDDAAGVRTNIGSVVLAWTGTALV